MLGHRRAVTNACCSQAVLRRFDYDLYIANHEKDRPSFPAGASAGR
jgi:hypothetical protein